MKDKENFEEDERVEDSLDFERDLDEDNEGFKVAGVEDDFERDEEENSEDIEIERDEDNNIALLNIDLNMPAHYDFDLNEFPDEEDEVFQERQKFDREEEIKEEVNNLLKIWVPRF